MSESEIIKGVLMYLVAPLWIAAGFADWLCHRAANIELNAGPNESLMHLLMLGESSVPVLAALFLEVNAAVIALAIAALVIHQITAMIDVRYATTKRTIRPNEQNVHSLLEIVPLMALVLLLIPHWTQLLALLGLGTEGADFGLHLKRQPLPTSYIVTLLVVIFLLEVVPFVEELWRGLRVNRRRFTGASALWQ